jgi:hypothetical protein
VNIQLPGILPSYVFWFIVICCDVVAISYLYKVVNHRDSLLSLSLSLSLFLKVNYIVLSKNIFYCVSSTDNLQIKIVNHC